MKTAISVTDIERQLIHQLSSFFKVSNEEVELINVKIGIISRCEYCFSRTDNKYYSCEGETYFNPYQSAQYTIFLYYFSNTIYHETTARLLADKLYYLNKVMNGCDLFANSIRRLILFSPPTSVPTQIMSPSVSIASAADWHHRSWRVGA